MKRLFAFAMSLGLVAVMAVPAMAGGPADKATGDVVRTNGSETWHTVFDAHAEMDGRPVKGTATGTQIGGPKYWTIDVTCAEPLGEKDGMVGFRFGGPTTSSNQPRPYIVLEVWDAGSPGSAGDTVETWVQQTLDCSPSGDGSLYETMLEGNLVVHVSK